MQGTADQMGRSFSGLTVQERTVSGVTVSATETVKRHFFSGAGTGANGQAISVGGSYVQRAWTMRAWNQSTATRTVHLEVYLLNPGGSIYSKNMVSFPRVESGETVEVLYEPYTDSDSRGPQSAIVKRMTVDGAVTEIDAYLGQPGKAIDNEKLLFNFKVLIGCLVFAALMFLMFVGIAAMMGNKPTTQPTHASYMPPRLSPYKSGSATILGKSLTVDFYRAADVNRFSKEKLLGGINALKFPRAAVITDGTPDHVGIDGNVAVSIPDGSLSHSRVFVPGGSVEVSGDVSYSSIFTGPLGSIEIGGGVVHAVLQGKNVHAMTYENAVVNGKRTQ